MNMALANGFDRQEVCVIGNSDRAKFKETWIKLKNSELGELKDCNLDMISQSF